MAIWQENLSKNLEAEDPKSEVENSELPVLVDCFATWCGPCKMLSPVIKSVSEKYAGSVKVIKVDIDKHEDFANVYAIKSIPTLLFFREGKLVKTEVGFRPENQLCKMIDQNLMPTADELKERIKGSKGALLVEFFTKDCTWCKKQEPVLKSLQEKYRDELKIIRIDAEKYEDLAKEYEVKNYPTMKLFYGAKEVKTLKGFEKEDALCRVIEDELLSKKK